MPYWFDGNNLIGQASARAREDPATRRAFLSFLSGCAGPGRHMVVFFDGDDPDRAMPPRGVQVRYSCPLSADDAILRRLREVRTPREVIVVSNDNRLRSQCRDAGAKTLSWAEFTSRVKPESPAPAKTGPKDGPVRVDEWVRYFGLDEKKLE
jgi:hypothetical protein